MAVIDAPIGLPAGFVPGQLSTSETVTIAYSGVEGALREAYPSLSVEGRPELEERFDANAFLQDGQVVLPDGKFLIPHELEEDDWLFVALLPEVEKHFVEGIFRGYGQGMLPEFRQRTIAIAKKYGAKFQEARSCIEGGNVRFAKRPTQELVAIVGVNSQTLSLIALEKQGYFSTVADFGERVAGAEPTEDDFRRARNVVYAKELQELQTTSKRLEKEYDAIFSAFFQNPGFKEQSNQAKEKYREALNAFQEKLRGYKGFAKAPISHEDRERLCHEARAYHVKWEMTKEVMAEELQVSRENLIIIAQHEFHIDMELFTIGSRVFLHSSELAKGELERMSIQKTDDYFRCLREEIPIQKPLLETNQSTLRDRGLEVVLVAGAYGHQAREPINFMNGFMVYGPEPEFVTNGVDRIYGETEERFQEQVGEKVRFLCTGSKVMQQMLRSEKGGLNCLALIRPNLQPGP